MSSSVRLRGRIRKQLNKQHRIHRSRVSNAKTPNGDDRMGEEEEAVEEKVQQVVEQPKQSEHNQQPKQHFEFKHQRIVQLFE